MSEGGEDTINVLVTCIILVFSIGKTFYGLRPSQLFN